MTKSFRIFIVVLNWNGVQDTCACLDSIASLTYPNFNVVTVDNGSSDNSLALLRAYQAPYPMTLLETGCNLGYAGGNNVGIRHAIQQGADYILVLNNDTKVSPDLIEQLVAAALRNPDAGALGARLLCMDRPTTVDFDGAYWNNSKLAFIYPGEGSEESLLLMEEKETDYICGAALFIRTEVAQHIGLFDEQYFLTWEESDWCFRARRAGYKCRMAPSAKVWHALAASFSGENSPLRIYFSIRNRLYWAERNLGGLSYLRMLMRGLISSIPDFTVADGPEPWIKRIYWAAQGYTLAWLGNGDRLEYLATRRAILDYLGHRFGDCPHEVRTWSKTWAARRS